MKKQGWIYAHVTGKVLDAELGDHLGLGLDVDRRGLAVVVVQLLEKRLVSTFRELGLERRAKSRFNSTSARRTRVEMQERVTGKLEWASLCKNVSKQAVREIEKSWMEKQTV